MHEITMTSIITLGLSATSVGLLSRFKHVIEETAQSKSIISTLDQMVRAVMLAFALFHIGPELLETFQLKSLMFAVIGFIGVQQSIQYVYAKTKNDFLQEKYPWLIYTLLIPHFISEGFVIAPQAGKNSLSIVIMGFLLHKIFEITMLTVSTNHQIHCRTQRTIVQTLFVVLTPLSLLAYSQYHTWLSISDTVMAYTEFLNFIVFVQLSMLCQFCTHGHDHSKSWLQKNSTFVWSFAIICVAVYFNPSLLI
jgi:hypothetical protein